jgi:uncharacterized protein with von Willebrand factor type A (vWA) domain
MTRNRYSRWDGSQDPLGAELPIDELADRLAEDVLDGWGIDNSLRRLLENGMDGRFDGLRQLRERLERMRQAQRERTGRPDPLSDAKQKLAEIEQLERSALAQDQGEEARFSELELDTLPDNTAARIRSLREHDWRSQDAREKFEELLDELRRDMLDASFRQMTEGMQSMTPEDMERVKDMLADLNAMMEAAGPGSRSEPAAVRRLHGQTRRVLPREPENLRRAARGDGPPCHGDVALHGLTHPRPAS